MMCVSARVCVIYKSSHRKKTCTHTNTTANKNTTNPYPNNHIKASPNKQTNKQTEKDMETHKWS